MSDGPLAGSVALVTGAARPRGIGRATALALAGAGADVGCLDIARPYESAPNHATATGDDLDQVVAEIVALGRRSVAIRADVSRADEVEAAIEHATEVLGTITLVANVAGGSGPGFGLGPLISLDESEFRHVLDVNLVGTWLVSRACAARMVAAGVGGRICNVSSQAGKRAFPLLGAYCTAKAGVILLTQTMALELGPFGIAVNAVCPGTVDTDLINPNGLFEQLVGGPDGLQAYLEREIPLRRLQSAQEIAATIAWLLSPDATAITGEAVNASAGQTMV
ncbi:MAG TPA: SDR family NAD(P)-dependent oxidoreductase [Acidimicrobiales bacterium]|nr:SDR family NAD(P)-dependent oxidoreductase [Acidimicrobiales bacterium]